MGFAQCSGTDGTAANRRCGLAPNHPDDCKFAAPRRRMYLDPAEDLAPHIGTHDENEFCEGAEPQCRPVTTLAVTTLVEGPNTVTHNANEPAWKTPPTHYTSKSGIQPWDVWDEFDLDRYTANAVKYILRAGKKDIAPRLDDLKKAANYIAKAIDMEENRE